MVQALDEAIRVAESCDSTLIVANDPDADRLAVAEKVPALVTDEEAKWHVFTGNELGVLLGHWQITRWQAGGGAPGAAVLASVVSSRMLRRIAQVEGMTYYDTLTGTITRLAGVCLSVYLSVCVCPVCLSVCLSVCLFVCLSVCLSVSEKSQGFTLAQRELLRSYI